MMIGIDGFLALSCLQTSRPLMRGIITSRITMSGDSLRARSRPATPSGAVSTWYPSNSKLSRNPATMLGSSSTIRILGMLSSLQTSRRRHFVSVDLGAHRQSNSELATSSRTAVHRYLAAMRLHNVAHQGKSQSAAFGVVDQRVSHSIKFLKYLVLLFRWDADAVVHDFQLHRTVVTEKIYADELLVLRILEGVVDQVQQGPRHGLAIHPQRRHIFSDLLLEGEPVLLDLEAIGIQRVVHQFPHVSLAEVVFFASCLDPREVQDVVDQRRQAFALFANDAVILLIFF